MSELSSVSELSSFQVAQYSDIGEGDHILLNKSHDNKMSPNFEPLPYKVVEKKGNAVLIQDQEGNTKLCNTSNMKKFIQPDPLTETTEPTEVHGEGKAEDMTTGRQFVTTALTPPTDIPVQVPFLQGPLVLGAFQHG